MYRKAFKSILLIIIFGVPVFWYLFLQFFGENQFHLEAIRSVDSRCFGEGVFVVLTQSPREVSEENQLARLEYSLASSSAVYVIDSVNCIPDTSRHSLYLIDDDTLRGAYFLTIDEIDQLIVEQDLLRVLYESRESAK